MVDGLLSEWSEKVNEKKPAQTGLVCVVKCDGNEE